LIADATGGNTGLGREGPQEFATLRIEGNQLARAAVAGEYETTGSGDGTHGGTLRRVGPDLFTAHRVPGDELGPAAARYGVRRIIVGSITTNKAHLQVEGTHAVAGRGGVGNAAFTRREVQPAGVEAVGH